MRLIPEPTPEVRQHLSNVFERAKRKDLPLPPWIAVDEGGSSWYLEASRQRHDERRKTIIATPDEEALLIAHRLGFGGALRLPPSTPAAIQALEAALANNPPAIDVDLLSWCMARSSHAWLVCWRHSGFWRQQLGGQALCALLHQLAVSLEIVPTLLGFPALLVAERTAEEIEAAWELIAGGRLDVPAEGIEIMPFDPKECLSTGLWLEASRVLVAQDQNVAYHMAPRSIYALPQGRRVGRWSATDVRSGDDDLWTPQGPRGDGLLWRSSSGGEIVEVTSSDGVLAHDDTTVRLPGWLSKRLRRGAPNGVLVERMAAASRRSGTTLWIPNVDQEALDHLLRLGIPLWVDGPAVPE